jgi:two-component system, cell cycle response regulator
MSTTAIVLVVFAALLVAGGIAAALVVRRRAGSDDRLASAVDEMRMRMDELAGNLSEALDRADRASRHGRLLSELGSSIDLEELLDRLLDAALQIADVDAAMVVLDEEGGSPLVSTRGMSAEEAARPPSTGAPAGGPSGTLTVNYRYGPDDFESEIERIRGGLFIPLIGRDSRQIGTMALFWRQSRREPSPQQVETLEQLAQDCIAAIENARRFREARQLAETDALTGLFNQRFFHETLRREVLRAQRYGRSLSLIIFDLDDLKSINDSIGHLAGDDVLAQAASRLRDAVRSVDIACRIGGDEFAVILPESGTADADQLYERVHKALSTTPLATGGRLRLSAGAAELQHGDTAPRLFERTDAALYRAKAAGKDRLELATGVEP